MTELLEIVKILAPIMIATLVYLTSQANARKIAAVADKVADSHAHLSTKRARVLDAVTPTEPPPQ